MLPACAPHRIAARIARRPPAPRPHWCESLRPKSEVRACVHPRLPLAHSPARPGAEGSRSDSLSERVLLPWALRAATRTWAPSNAWRPHTMRPRPLPPRTSGRWRRDRLLGRTLIAAADRPHSARFLASSLRCPSTAQPERSSRARAHVTGDGSAGVRSTPRGRRG